MLNLTTKKNSARLSWNQVLCQLSNKLKSVSDNANFEAQEIASFVSGKPQTWIAAHDDIKVTPSIMRRLDTIVQKRLKGKPLFYILGHCDFFGLELKIDNSVLIPRPETEMIVNNVITFLRYAKSPKKIIDIGTGSSAIAVAVGDYCAKNKIDVKIIASDISKSALNIARKNINKYQLGKIVTLKRSDLLKSIDDEFDIVVANLPYVETDKISSLPDPQLALDGGRDGFDLIAKLLHQINNKKVLSKSGVAIFEMGHNHEQQFRELATALFPTAKIDIIKDLAGCPRVGIVYSR